MFLLPSIPTILVFLYQTQLQNSDRVTLSGGIKYRCGKIPHIPTYTPMLLLTYEANYNDRKLHVSYCFYCCIQGKGKFRFV